MVINILVGLASIGAFVSLGALFSGQHIMFDLISHFRVQYIVMLLPAFLFAIFAKKTIPVLIISLALAIHGYVVTMSLLAVSVTKDADFQELTVLNSNLLLINDNYEAQFDIIVAENPDVIAFQEYSFEWHKVLSDELTDYPHRITHANHGAFGIAVYSKHPITSGGLDDYSHKTYPIISVDIQLTNTNIRVIAVHPPPPGSHAMYAVRNHTMKSIALESQSQDKPVIVVGDFNSTPWTAHFSDMTSVGGLRNARAGFGFHPTWPSEMFPLLIPIDHILVNDEIGVSHFASLFFKGSDHRNIVSRLRIY